MMLQPKNAISPTFRDDAADSYPEFFISWFLLCLYSLFTDISMSSPFTFVLQTWKGNVGSHNTPALPLSLLHTANTAILNAQDEFQGFFFKWNYSIQGIFSLTCIGVNKLLQSVCTCFQAATRTKWNQSSLLLKWPGFWSAFSSNHQSTNQHGWVCNDLQFWVWKRKCLKYVTKD